MNIIITKFLNDDLNIKKSKLVSIDHGYTNLLLVIEYCKNNI